MLKIKLQLKYSNNIKIKLIKADKVDIDKPYLAFQFGDEMRYFELDILTKEQIISTLKGNYIHKFPNTDREEFWVRVDMKKWKELKLNE